MQFSEIYEESEEQVYRFLLGLCGDEALAEELTAETFYQAFLHLDQFEGRSELTTWLCQIAKNLYLKELRRRKRVQPEENWDNQQAPNLFDQLEEREQTLQIHRILRTLPEPYREVFSMHIFDELTFREISELLGKSESWAKMTFYRAKAKLLEKLEAQNETDE